MIIITLDFDTVSARSGVLRADYITRNKTEGGEDSRWHCENNPGLELSLNPQTVSQSCISRLIFVAHRTGKLPSIKKTWDARQ